MNLMIDENDLKHRVEKENLTSEYFETCDGCGGKFVLYEVFLNIKNKILCNKCEKSFFRVVSSLLKKM